MHASECLLLKDVDLDIATVDLVSRDDDNCSREWLAINDRAVCRLQILQPPLTVVISKKGMTCRDSRIPLLQNRTQGLTDRIDPSFRVRVLGGLALVCLAMLCLAALGNGLRRRLIPTAQDGS